MNSISRTLVKNLLKMGSQTNLNKVPFKFNLISNSLKDKISPLRLKYLIMKYIYNSRKLLTAYHNNCLTTIMLNPSNQRSSTINHLLFQSLEELKVNRHYLSRSFVRSVKIAKSVKSVKTSSSIKHVSMNLIEL